MNWQQSVWLFFCYSILGWVIEVLFEAAVRRRYIDRGVLNGPWCIIYGVAGVVLTWALVVFMAINVCVSSAALVRVGQRAAGQPAVNRADVWLDEHYDDDVMARIYPNAIRTADKDQ